MTPLERASNTLHSSRAARFALAFGLPFLLFVLTLHPGVGGRVNHGDSAKFQFIGVIAGISHPPGNPLYMVFNILSAHIPIGSPALRASVLSAAFGALAVALISASARRLRGPYAAVASGGLLALGSLFWTLSTEAEVYTLNAALLAGTIYALCRWEQERTEKWLLVGLFTFVIAFANHLTMVAAFPALAYAAIRIAWLKRFSLKVYATGVATSLLVVALYGYIPLRCYDAVYSEFPGVFTSDAFIEFVTAKKFAGEFHVPTWKVLLDERLPQMAPLLLKQWLWPVWGLALLGSIRGLVTTRAVGGFVLLAALGFLAFAALYGIDDPDGFYVPIACLAAFAIAFVVPLRGIAAPLVVVGLAACAFPVARTHLLAWQKLDDCALIETLDDRGPVLWDLPDLIARVPEGAEIVLPCDHYGCLETWNYFRFADETAATRHLSWVRLEGGHEYAMSSEPHKIYPSEAKSHVVCTLHNADANLWRSVGARVDTIPRPKKVLHSGTFPGQPIYCSVPEPSSVAAR